MKSIDPELVLPDHSETAALRAIASTLARQAGALAVQMRDSHLSIEEQKTTEFDVATDADVACEQLLRTELARVRPQDGILGEEGTSVSGTSGLTWVIDPIDGTTNFLYGLPQWSVSIAVVAGPPDDMRNWTPVAAAVYQPDGRVLYDAGRGLGAARNGLAITGPGSRAHGEVSELRAALIAVGFHYIPAARRQQARIAAQLADQVRDLRDHGATSVELGLVAEGAIDGYWEERLSPWDVAGGLLVAAEAGCKIRWQERSCSTGMELGLIVCRELALADALSTALTTAH